MNGLNKYAEKEELKRLVAVMSACAHGETERHGTKVQLKLRPGGEHKNRLIAAFLRTAGDLKAAKSVATAFTIIAHFALALKASLGSKADPITFAVTDTLASAAGRTLVSTDNAAARSDFYHAISSGNEATVIQCLNRLWP